MSKRFWAKVSMPDQCWLWCGAQTRGYGQATLNGRHGYAHRLSWELHYGPIPPGAHVCHKCDTPLCVNPTHLFLGTPKDNVHDCISKGRKKYGVSKGEANGASKLNAEKVDAIRNSRANGSTYRSIAKQFGIGKSQVANIVRGRSWGHTHGI